MERVLPMDGQELAIVDFKATDYSNDHTLTTDLDRANCITSIMIPPTPYGIAGIDLHRPVIDIDLPVTVVPSSTPGHFHLYIDKPMDWYTYLNLLDAMAAAGIVEPGYVSSARKRGHTAVRLPWITKAPDGREHQRR
jgi:hypothetical protein